MHKIILLLIFHTMSRSTILLNRISPLTVIRGEPICCTIKCYERIDLKPGLSCDNSLFFYTPLILQNIV